MIITILTLITMLVFATMILISACMLNSTQGQLEEQAHNNDARLLMLTE